MPPQGGVHAAVRPFGTLPDARTLASRIAEPLLESAPHAFTTAMAQCPHDSACQVYHAIWQYLRLAEIVRSVRVDGPIYAAVAERMARAGQLRRVLITATADFSMLAHLAYGARLAGVKVEFSILDQCATLAGVKVEFSILDQCATALHLNTWYADRNGLDVRPIQSDVLAYDGPGEYDLICTHSLLTLLPPTSRERLFRQWRRLLARDGRICFSNRVWNHHLHLTQREIDQRSAAMAEGAIRKLEQNGVPLPCPADHFAKLVTRYNERYGNRSTDLPPLPLSDIERWAQDAGLDIEIAVPADEVVADASDQAPGPFPTERGPRMWFQLHRA